MKSENKNVLAGFFRRLFEKRHFDKAGAMASFVIFTTVCGGMGLFALGGWGLGWLVNRHPEVLLGIVGAVAFGLLLLIFFNGAFPKKNEADGEDAGPADEAMFHRRRLSSGLDRPNGLDKMQLAWETGTVGADDAGA